MTVVGKILVFLNLVFSLVVGAFAVLSYSAGSNHAAGFAELKSRYEVANATTSAYKQENDKLRDQARTFREAMAKRGVKESDDLGAVAKSLGAAIDARDKRIQALERDVQVAKAEAAAQLKARQAATGTSEDATASNARRGKGAADLQAAMDALAVKNSKLGQQLSSEMDLRVQAELQAATLKDQNKQLEATQRELLRDLARARSSITRGPSAPTDRVAPGAMPPPPRPGSSDNPPPESVEGRITRVDGTLVSVSIGKDSGLEVGNTLQVYRLGANPKYLGKIVLTEVQNKVAVGRIVGRPTAPMRVDDKVGSSILGGGR